MGNALVDLAAKAVPDAEFVFVVPDAEASSCELGSQGADDVILVFAGVGDEHVILG